MIKKLFLFAFAFIHFNAWGYTLGQRSDNRLNGTGWAGLEYGILNTAEDKNTADYHKQLLLFNVGINFVETEITWHDEENAEWDISNVTICRIKLGKTNDKKALKVWGRMEKKHKNDMEDLERAFCAPELRFDVMDDTTLYVLDLHIKYHFEERQLIFDLKKENDTIIALFDAKGNIAKTINFCKNFSARNADLTNGALIKDAKWTYWIEDKMFYFCFGHMNYILRCPFTMSADGKTFKLVLKKKKD